MKVALTLFIICLAMGLFLTGIGCNGEQQQPKLKPTQTPEDDLWKTLEEKRKALEDLEKKRLEGYMTASESRIWLAKNHYQVQKKADGNGYVITRDYYDPSTGHQDKSRNEIGGRGTVGVGNVTMTINEKGDLRVKVSGTQQ